MKRFSFSLAVLLFAFAPALIAQSSDGDSLGDVARQSRAHTSTPKKVYDDQNGDFGRAEDRDTPCGAPIQMLPAGYVSSTLGSPIADEQVTKALLKWFDQHPDLDLVHPEDLARLTFPHTPVQAKTNQQLALDAADRWVAQLPSVGPQTDPAQLSAAVDAVMNSVTVSNANTVLTKVVEAEKQRRIRSDGSPADKLQEATNLYSICESRRQVQFQEEVDKLAKQYFQRRVSQLVAASDPKAKQVDPSQKGM